MARVKAKWVKAHPVEVPEVGAFVGSKPQYRNYVVGRKPGHPTHEYYVKTKRVGNIASPRRLHTALRRRQCVLLRLAGKSYVEIGEEMNIGASQAWQYVTSSVELLNDTIKEKLPMVIDMELQRLDSMLAELWPNRRDPRTADSILRIMDRRSKFQGLDAAERREVHVTGLEGVSNEEIIRRVQGIIESQKEGGAGDAADGAEEEK
jgi:DNA-binding CsgD family transcriptional regulator